MNRFFLLAALMTRLLSSQSPPSSPWPRVVVLDVLVENVVIYRLDVTDPTTFASLPRPVTPPPSRTFQEFIGIGDIVSVNGKPARGVWTNFGHTLPFTPTPVPGEAIANVSTAGHIECTWEFYTSDGTFVGRLNDRGIGGGPVTRGG